MRTLMWAGILFLVSVFRFAVVRGEACVPVCAEWPDGVDGTVSGAASGSAVNSGGAEQEESGLAFDLPAVVGDWRGQMQFQGVQSGQQLDAAHSVCRRCCLLLRMGAIARTDESYLGAWGDAETVAHDNTLAECHYAGLNRRYSGNMVTGNVDKSAQFKIRVTDRS